MIRELAQDGPAPVPEQPVDLARQFLELTPERRARAFEQAATQRAVTP